MKAIAFIPARMGSSRFPGKPMANIHGIPMIGHCYFRSKMCSELHSTYVATCDQEIYDYIKSINGDVVMTFKNHERATDRIAEALIKVEDQTGDRFDLVVMVQGDEPMVVPEMISQAIKPFEDDNNVQVVNLMSPINSVGDFEDPNEVKVVVDNGNNALYFSREPIPSLKKWNGEVSMLKQVCIIPFRRDFLIQFNNMQSTNLEKIESIDMLRILEHGYKVRMVFSDFETYSVDTQKDLDKVQSLMESDHLLKEYL